MQEVSAVAERLAQELYEAGQQHQTTLWCGIRDNWSLAQGGSRTDEVEADTSRFGGLFW